MEIYHESVKLPLNNESFFSTTQAIGLYVIMTYTDGLHKNRGATLCELRPDSVENVYLFYLLKVCILNIVIRI